MNINIMKLAEMEKDLIRYLHENDYSKNTIHKFHSVFAYIQKVIHIEHLRTYEDVLKRYKEEHIAKDHRFFTSMLSIIRFFELNGEYPTNKCHLVGSGKTSYEKLPNEFRRVIDTYKEHDLARGKLKSTVYVESISGITFLLKMLKQGISSLEDITEETVLCAFHDREGLLNKSCSYKKNVKAVFRGCLENETFDSSIISQIISFFPKIKQIRKNIQYLTAEEFRLLKTCLLAEQSPVCLRNRAIGLLAMYTGLRGCDIMGLRMDSIDWEKDVIIISQQKTAVPWNLTLGPVVGNAIFDYIVNDRSQTDVAEIFLSQHHPYGRMKPSAAYNVSKTIMKACKIRKNLGDRMGLHIFRHHLATELLSKNVPLPVISKILGHSSPSSTETYLSADMVHLKECSLSIENFPIGLEVLR
jgi:integrase